MATESGSDGDISRPKKPGLGNNEAAEPWNEAKKKKHNMSVRVCSWKMGKGSTWQKRFGSMETENERRWDQKASLGAKMRQ